MNQRFLIFLFFYLVTTHNFSSNSDCVANKPAISWIFSPGMNANERQVTRYCGQYRTSTGQIVSAEGISVLHADQTTSVNFSEIIMPNESGHQQASWFKSPAHFLAATYNAIVSQRMARYDMYENVKISPATTVNDVSKNNIDHTKINLAQEADIEALSLAYDMHVERFPDVPIVMYGVSRGAATTLRFMTTVYLTKKIKLVKAVVLEGCFDSIEHLLREKFAPLVNAIPGSFPFIKKMFSVVFPSHDFDGPSPIQNAANFPLDIPILFITSKEDHLVPAVCTKTLYNKLLETGHKDAYLVELEKSSHPRYCNEDKEDVQKYQEAVMAFYEQYEIAYNA